MRLVQTLQFAWFAGHVVLLFSTAHYGFNYIMFRYYNKLAQLSYRVAFISAAVTYGIVVYKAYNARMRAGKPNGALSLLTDENVQYLGMALVWLFSRQIPLAMLPFAVYSVFHVATYVRSNFLIAPQPQSQNGTGQQSPGPKQKHTPMGEAVGRFIKEYYDTSMMLVAILEIVLWFRVLGSALLFQKGSFMLLVLYTVFFRARYSQSSFMQGAIAQLTARADAALANQSTPPAVRQAWDTAKGLARQAVDATDMNKYVGAPPQKKAQ